MDLWEVLPALLPGSPTTGTTKDKLHSYFRSDLASTHAPWKTFTMEPARLLRWSARISGSALLAFLLFMLIGTITGDSCEADGLRFHDTLT